VPKYSNSDKIVNLVKEFLLYEFTEENIENFKKKGSEGLRRFSKLNEIDLEANGSYSQSKKIISFNENENKRSAAAELDQINETLQEINLTDQLLLSSERHLEVGKTNLLDSEVANFESASSSTKTNKAKERFKKGKNQADSALSLSVEMRDFDSKSNYYDKGNMAAKGSKSSDAASRIENVENIEEEIVIKESRGPLLFKIDNYELEYIRVWRRIKIGILSLSLITGFLFYISLPIFISFSNGN